MNEVVGTIRLNLRFDHPVTAFALVIGGWFPLSLAFSSILLIDRNILGILEVASGARSRADSEGNAWWFKYLNRKDCRINPILCAMEGNQQTHSTYEQLVSEYEKSASNIRRHLPNATVVELDERALLAAHTTLCDTRETYDRSILFLNSVAPVLAHRVATSRLNAVEQDIYILSYRHGLPVFSLPVITALSCLYEPEDGSEPMIGRNIIKPAQNYSDRNAHNAIWDLRSLEYFALASGIGIGKLAFCTRDRYMVALWCALHAQAGHIVDRVGTFNITLGEELFPRLSSKKCDQLYHRMLEFSSNNAIH